MDGFFLSESVHGTWAAVCLQAVVTSSVPPGFWIIETAQFQQSDLRMSGVFTVSAKYLLKKRHKYSLKE